MKAQERKRLTLKRISGFHAMGAGARCCKRSRVKTYIEIYNRKELTMLQRGGKCRDVASAIEEGMQRTMRKRYIS